MSAKARDGQGRWRNKTIGFRVSEEENAEINALAALAGMSKQDYIICRLTNKDVTVVGNPRVHKALKKQMEQLYLEFQRLCDATQISTETLQVLQYLATIYDGMQGNNTL